MKLIILKGPHGSPLDRINVVAAFTRGQSYLLFNIDFSKINPFKIENLTHYNGEPLLHAEML